MRRAPSGSAPWSRSQATSRSFSRAGGHVQRRAVGGGVAGVYERRVLFHHHDGAVGVAGRERAEQVVGAPARSRIPLAASRRFCSSSSMMRDDLVVAALDGDGVGCRRVAVGIDATRARRRRAPSGCGPSPVTFSSTAWCSTCRLSMRHPRQLGARVQHRANVRPDSAARTASMSRRTVAPSTNALSFGQLSNPYARASHELRVVERERRPDRRRDIAP